MQIVRELSGLAVNGKLKAKLSNRFCSTLRPIVENMQDVEKSTKVLEALIESEASELSNFGGRSRIIIGGFSQGGAIALNTLLAAKEKFAGCVALSTVIPGKV